MLNSNLIQIQVTPDIATKIRLLAESGFFAIKTGSAQCNFHEGVLKSIKTELLTYAHDIHIDTTVKGLILKA